MRKLLPTLLISTLLISSAAHATTENPNDAGMESNLLAMLKTAISTNVTTQKAENIDNPGVKEAISEGLNPKVAKLALHAYEKADNEGHVKQHIITVIDYSLPSDQKRLWVVDLDKKKLLHNTFVAHGQKSGKRYATHFSNKNGSHETSIGVFETKNVYTGHNGYSLRLAGLEKGINDKALERAIVIHGASYVSKGVIKSTGRAGRSWGCPSVPKSKAKPLINDIKGGSLVFAYYPDSSWLKHSKYLA